MKKGIYILFILMAVLILTGCTKKYKITFLYEDGKEIISLKVERGSSVGYPSTNVEEGYYYEWSKTPLELTGIENNIEVIAIKKECQKVCKYYINDDLVKEETTNYFNTVDAPEIPKYAKNPKWIETKTFQNHIYYYDYVLSYEMQYSVYFKYEDGTLISVVNVDEFGNASFPPLKDAETGYYYEWNKTNEELTNITSDIEVIAVKKAYEKECIYYFDETILKEETVSYFTEVEAPEYPINVKNPRWIQTITFKNNKYYFEYRLEYDSKLGTIVYYDGSKKLDLTPNVYWTNETVQLPTYEKENAEFIGWFISDISLCRYNEYTGTTDGELVLYARFVSKDTPIELPDSMYKFTDIKKTPHSSGNGTYVYQPVMPSDISITSVTQYDWSTSDTSIATVSAYSSITAKKAGFCVLTATLKTDASVTINCLIKVSTEGVFFSTLEEANAPSIVEVTFVDKDEEVIEKQFVKKGQYAIPPIPPIYDGLAFCGWNHDIYNITENITIKATYTTGTNSYVGKKFAIIGDSISTYQDYIPEGYASFYPYPTADVNDVNQTWWMQAINQLGGNLFINNSYSGSCVSTGGSSAGTNDTRLSKLKVGNEQPDVIIIYMGSNDCASAYVSLDSFQSAYKIMITKIKKLCPNSEIIVCTLPTTVFYSKQNQTDYNRVITECAAENNLKTIYLDEIDISNYLVDSAHPLKSGMTLIADKVVEYLLK